MSYTRRKSSYFSRTETEEQRRERRRQRVNDGVTIVRAAHATAAMLAGLIGCGIGHSRTAIAKMTRERTIRVLRIITSAVFGVLCLLCITFWVPSYRNMYAVGISGNSVATINGRFLFNGALLRTDGSVNADSRYRLGRLTVTTAPAGRYTPMGRGLSIPTWLAVLATAAFTVMPWIHWSRRFSLWTLLITTTLVALALGAVVIAAR